MPTIISPDHLGLIGGDFHGSDLLTGGSFGPEASVIAIVVCLAAAAYFLSLAKKNGRIVPRPRKQRVLVSDVPLRATAQPK